MDILVALGEYENGRIEFPGLGSRLKYDPGTIVAFMGRLATWVKLSGGPSMHSILYEVKRG